MTLRPLFVTPVYEASLTTDRSFENFNHEILEACRSLESEDAAGRAWSRAHGYGGYTSYGSLDDLPWPPRPVRARSSSRIRACR